MLQCSFDFLPHGNSKDDNDDNDGDYQNSYGAMLLLNQEAVMNGDPVQEAPLKPSVAPRVFCFPCRNPLNPSPRPYSSLVALSPPVPPTAQPSEHGGFCFAGPYSW